MPNPPPKFPNVIWDGLTNNTDRTSRNNNINPDAEDWERITSEVISVQQNNTARVLPTITSSGAVTVTEDDITYPLVTSAILLCDTTAGEITINLPSALSMSGQTLNIKKLDGAANAVVIDPDGAETIDDLTTQSLSSQYDSLTIVSNGVSWYIL